MNNQPFFSIIIPTKDRPELVKNTLYSLSLQNFNDFEVIVSDNFTNNSCRSVCEIYENDFGLKYYKPDNFLIMTDNFEFALSKASGKYVTILEDKFMFYPYALQYLFNILSKKDLDYISYPYDFYYPNDINDSFGCNKLYYNSKIPYPIHSKNQITKHLNFDPFPIFNASSIPNTGYMLSGFFKATLLESIKKEMGSVFLPPAPDLTSQIFISFKATNAEYTGFPMVLVYNSAKYSTGRMQDKSASFMEKSWATLDPNNIIMPFIPYPEFTSSISNFIAANYYYALSLIGEKNIINYTNLLFRIKDDMDKHCFDKNGEQINLIDEKIKKISIFKRFLNYVKVKYGVYWNKYILFDYIGVNFWPLNLMKKYKILKNHRFIIKNMEQDEKMTIPEALEKGNLHYKNVGFLDYEI